MYVHRSNSADALVDALEAIVRVPVGSPTEAECIVVQGAGMERWLSSELARRLGVWANPSFPFPRSIIDRAFSCVLGDEMPQGGAFQPGALLWSIARLLREHAREPSFALIRNYLAGDQDHSKRIQLAGRIAETFDRYSIYRPEMVLGWERGMGNDWQAVLWRALIKTAPESAHIATLARAFFRKLTAQTGTIAGFPERLSLFGISTLPPLYLRVLSELARRVDVRLFILSPSREYWGDIQSSRETLRSLFTEGLGDAPALEDLAQPDGNPLLASMGRLHGDFQQVLELTDDYLEPDDDLYRESSPGGASPGTMLETLQSDVLALRNRHRGNSEAPPRQLGSGDNTITVHSCHGPMREVEVLHDQLLALLDASPQLQARDVVVMMPKVEDYAPLIEAVFGGERGDRPQLPYRIADRSARATDEVVDALARILAVLGGRLSAPEVLDILTMDVVRERFGIAADDLVTIRTWVAETGIRWGIDHEHRAAVGQPSYQENTWRFGLDRLLLGYAMPGPELFAEVLPFDDIEGSATALLGRFVDYCDTLFAFAEVVRQRRSVSEWQLELQKLLGAMVVETESNAPEHQGLRDAFAGLAQNAEAAEFTEEVPLDTLRSLLEAEWLSGGSARGFMSGGVTFCQLRPLRSIPFGVVCLLGMSDGAFPSSSQPVGFDLAAASPRIGDHAPRDDDRYLFLEALLAARSHLLITYVGQSIQNNRTVPPSVLVGELLDTLDESFEAETSSGSEPPAKSVRERVVVRHPLQPFSPVHFTAADQPRVFSYSGAYCDAARTLRQPREAVPPFLAGALPVDVEDAEDAKDAKDAKDERGLTIDQLARYFTRPTQVFTEHRLGLDLREDLVALSDREPISIGGLEAWALGTELLERALQGDSLEQALPALRGGGAIPLGTIGKISAADTTKQAAAIGQAATELQDGDALDGLAIDQVLDGTRITGTLENLWPQAQITAQFAKLSRRSELGLWIRHLILCWQAPEGYPTESVAVGRADRGANSAAMRFRPVEQPQELLGDLLRLYWLGQTAPLLLFPQASRAYAASLSAPASDAVDEAALKTAYGEFYRTHGAPGESDDVYVKQLFGAADPLDPAYRPLPELPEDYPSFAETARLVFLPLLEHREAL